MRRFARDIFLFVMTQAVVAAVVLWHVDIDRNHYLASTIDKHHRLETLESPRMVFVGGSSSSFGLDCGLIEQSLPGYRPVNMGLAAPLGIAFMLEEVRQEVRTGDVVVLALEYDQFLRDQSNYLVLKVAEQRPECLAYVDWTLVSDIGLNYFGRLVRRGVKGLQGKSSDQSEAPYVRDGFNEYGDLTAHRHMKPPEYSDHSFKWSPASGKHLARTIKRLNAYHAELRQRGVTVVLIYPPYVRERLLDGDQRTVVDRIDRQLRTDLTIPILDTPLEASLPRSHFFDTPYHLGDRGVIARSARLAKLLRQHLQQGPTTD